MYTIYVLWLLQAVLILLLAMVGSIVITIKPNSSPLQVGRISNKPIKLGKRSFSTKATQLVPIKVYKNPDKDKLHIITENNGKAGVYRSLSSLAEEPRLTSHGLINP